MSMTLTFTEAAWSRARGLAVAGCKADALAALAPLLTGDAVPKRLRLLAHRLAARLHHAAGRYRHARRELAHALKLEPGTAEVHYEIALALELDPTGSDERATRRYRKAVAIAPQDARFVAGYGRSLVRTFRTCAGLAKLREASRLAPTQPAVLRVVLEGFAEAGRAREAYRIVKQAQFARTPELAKLLTEAKFRVAAGRVPARRPRLKLVGVRHDAPQVVARGPRFLTGEGGDLLG